MANEKVQIENALREQMGDGFKNYMVVEVEQLMQKLSGSSFTIDEIVSSYVKKQSRIKK